MFGKLYKIIMTNFRHCFALLRGRLIHIKIFNKSIGVFRHMSLSQIINAFKTKK